MTPFLFVYGTLLPSTHGDLGARERARLMAAGVFLGPALTQGILLDFGGYPGMMPGAGLIHGGVYKLNDLPSVFAWLDAYEGISGSPNDEYQRREISVTLESGEAITASAYVHLKDGATWPVITSGRWHGHQA